MLFNMFILCRILSMTISQAMWENMKVIINYIIFICDCINNNITIYSKIISTIE